MKNIKDRTIRVENIPDDRLIYQAYEGFSYTFFVVFLFGFGLIVLSVQYYIIIIILLLIYIFMPGQYKVKYEVRENFMLHYLSDEIAEIFYYGEIINYRIIGAQKHSMVLRILTDDENEHSFNLSDTKVIEALEKVIGVKRVG